MAHKRRQKANATIERSVTFPPTSSGQQFSSFPSFPTTAYSPHMAQGVAALHQQRHVSNYESNKSFSHHSTLMVKSDKAVLFEKPSNDISQGTGLDAGTSSQGEFVQINVEKSSLSKDFENETSERKRNLCVPLLQAALKGDWGAAKAILDRYPDDVQVPITLQNDTALHVAAIAKRTPFVKEMMKLTTPEDSELKTKSTMTALHFAARSGMVGVAKEMVEMNSELPLIRNRYGRTPVQAAARLGYRDMVSYLPIVTPFEQLNTFEHIELLLATISTELYDIALVILKKDPKLAVEKDEHGNIALQELAKGLLQLAAKVKYQSGKDVLLEFTQYVKGGPNSTPKNALSSERCHNFIRSTLTSFSSNVGLPTRPLTCSGRTSKPTRRNG